MAQERMVSRVQQLYLGLNSAATHQSIGFIIGVNSETRKTQKVSYRNDELVLRQFGLDVGEIRSEKVGRQGGCCQQGNPFAVCDVNALMSGKQLLCGILGTDS